MLWMMEWFIVHEFHEYSMHCTVLEPVLPNTLVTLAGSIGYTQLVSMMVAWQQSHRAY